MSRASYSQQYEELELTYREARAHLARIERDPKRTPQERGLKAQRLLILREARNTLYDLARQDASAVRITQPADFAA